MLTRYPLVALITVQGGKPPESGPCDPRSSARLLRQGSRDGRRDRRLDAGKTVSEKYPVSVLRRHHLPVVVPAVPGAAADRAPDPALVRRQRGGVDHLHAVLPGAAAGRLCLRALPDASCPASAQQAVCTPCCSLAAVATLPIAPGEAWKPARHRGADHAHPAAARRRASACLTSCSRRPARCCRPGSRARGPAQNPYRLFAISNLASLLALIGYPFAGRAVLRRRASRWRSGPGCSPRSRSSARSWPGCTPPAGHATSGPRTLRARAREPTYAAVARALGDRLGAAARGHQPPHAERRRGAAALARAAHALPASFIITFEGKGWYQPRMAAGASCSVWLGAHGAGCWSTRDFQFDLVVQLGDVPAGPVRRPACSATASSTSCGPAPRRLTALLPRGLGGRRARRPAGGGGRAAGLQRLLRARRRRWWRSRALAALRFALAQPGRALRQPRGAARRRRLRRLRRLRATSSDVRVADAQLLRRAAREGVRASRARSRTCAAWCTARSCTASSTCTTSSAPQLTTYYQRDSGIGAAIRSLRERRARRASA